MNKCTKNKNLSFCFYYLSLSKANGVARQHKEEKDFTSVPSCQHYFTVPTLSKRSATLLLLGCIHL